MKRADAIALGLFAIALIVMGAATIIESRAVRTIEIGDLYIMDATNAPWCLDIFINGTRHVMAFRTTDDADAYVRALRADARLNVIDKGGEE